MSREPKYSIDVFFSGAAPKKKPMHWSSPSCYLMRLKIRKLATEYMKGGSLCSILATVFDQPYPFAHPLMLCTKPGLVEAISFSLSSNFSHTRGTAKNVVGRAH